MIWRLMTGEDMDAVSAVSDAVHGPYTEPRAVYAERRDLYPTGCFVLETDNGVVGYLIVHPWRHEAPPPLGEMVHALPNTADSLYLHDLALTPDVRGTGMGASGTAIAFDLAVSTGLYDLFLLAVGNADRFWATRGFTPVRNVALADHLCTAYGPEVIYIHCRVSST